MKQQRASRHAIGGRRDRMVPYLFILPYLASFTLFFAFPAGYSLVLSFFNYKGYGAARFIGLQNYQALLNYSGFWKSIGNTLFYFGVHLIPVIGGAFLFALLLQSTSLGKWRKVIKPILFLPQVIPVMAATLTFRIIFATHTGAINQLLGLGIRWLDDPAVMRWSVVVLLVWRATGWFMIVFLAGLTTINPSLYEAAIIDGATPLQRTAHITIPLMRPIFLFALIMDAISSFKIYTEVNVLIGGTLNAPTDAMPIMNMVTNNMRNGSFGMASAAGWLLFFMILGVSILEMLLMRERGEQP